LKQRKIPLGKLDINFKLNISIIAAVFMLITSINTAFSQQETNLQVFHNLFLQKDANHKIKKTEYKNEIQFISLEIYLFYKNFISSQDENHCYFYPSCSNYAILSVQKKGVILGLFSAFDRLTRCNNHSKNKYPIHKNTGLLFDYP